MLIAFVVAAHERERALRLAQWIEELGAGKGHQVLLTLTQAAKQTGLDVELNPILSRAFDSYSEMVPFDSVEITWGHPAWDASSANHLFTRVNRHIEQHFGCPYLYLEMDAAPTRETAFSELEDEYQVALSNGKPFMGDKVDNGRHPVHMSGVAVYPADIINNAKTLGAIDWNCYKMPDPRRSQMAWDIASCHEVVPKAHFTGLIQHSYQYTQPCQAAAQWNGTAALFHQCKCGCLIDRLRKEPRIPKAAQQPNSGKITVFPKDYLTNTVFTYFQPVPTIDVTEQLALIDLWRFSWRKAGWNPVVLDGARYGGIAGNLAELPSVNAPGYDLACFTRWLVMGEHGGWMCDYDVMNNGFEPQPIPERLTVYQDDKPCPSLVAGPALEFLRLAKIFATRGSDYVGLENGKPHISDQNILQAIPDEYDHQKIVIQHRNYGWQTAEAIHFANQTMEGHQPRSTWIPKLLYASPASNGYGGIAKGIRGHVGALASIVDGNTGRKTVMREELRKAHLLR